MKKIKDYLSQGINILGFTKPRLVWLLFWIFSVLFLGVFFLFLAKFISSFKTEILNVMAFGFGATIFILFVIILLRIFLNNRLRGYILITLFVSGIAFLVEKYFLNNEIFAPFTYRTTILLWISFIILFLSIFYQRISKWILLFFPPILIIGFLVSFSFVLIMLPFMLIGWIAILFLGLGFLPYAPLMANVAFIVMCYKCFSELRDNKYYLQYTFSKYLTYGTLIFVSIYFIWFHAEWNKGQLIIRNHFLEHKIINSKKSLIDDDLPAWASLGMKLPVNHVSELYLQPESGNSGTQFNLFGSDKLFDPFAFVISNISKKTDIPNEDREHLLKLLFGYTHISLDRLWNGNSLLTTDVKTHIQLYPESRVVYTEIELSVYNDSQNGNQEAIYTFKTPEGSTCTKLSLWIDGKEELARLTYLSKAQTAYNTIVGRERRDPSYVTWMDDNLFRVRVFPVAGKNFRTFKIGFLSPLASLHDKLFYQGFQMEGPLSNSAYHRIELDMFEAKDTNIFGKGYTIEKKINHSDKSKYSKWFAYGKYKDNWGIYIDKPKEIAGEFQFSNFKFKTSDLEFIEQDFLPQKIYILINSSLGKKEWKNVYSEIAALGLNAQIILVTNEWFYSKNWDENIDFIDSQVLPKFNLFPFYKIANETDILIITNAEESSIPFSELKGSSFYNKNKEFFSKNKKTIYVQSLNGKLSTYFNSLKEYELIQDLPISLSTLSRNLQLEKISLPIQSESKFSFPNSQFTIEIEKHTDKFKKSGNDLLARLIIYKKLMRMLGKSMKVNHKDITEDDLFDLAEQGMVVSPITSLIVLEAERDYARFGINKSKTGLGLSNIHTDESNASNLKHGNIPEPEEWVIFIICIVLFLFWKKYITSRA